MNRLTNDHKSGASNVSTFRTLQGVHGIERIINKL